MTLEFGFGECVRLEIGTAASHVLQSLADKITYSVFFFIPPLLSTSIGCTAKPAAWLNKLTEALPFLSRLIARKSEGLK
jgi:hypothetical protein